MVNFKFNLGDEVQDVITSYKGIIRGRSQYLTGCNTYGIQSQKLNKDGQLAEWVWFDENQLKVIKAGKIKLKPVDTSGRTGGPHSADQLPPH